MHSNIVRNESKVLMFGGGRCNFSNRKGTYEKFQITSPHPGNRYQSLDRNAIKGQSRIWGLFVLMSQ